MRPLRDAPLVSAVQMPERVLRGGVTQRRQLADGRVRAQPQRLLVDARHRFEQRPVEQLGVQPAHAVRVALDLRVEHAERVLAAVRPHVRRAGQPAQRLLVVGGWAGCVCAAASATAADARAGAGIRRTQSRFAASSRPTYPRAASAVSASTVLWTCSASSARPCTSCRSWTANSTSRRLPRPSLSSRSRSSGGNRSPPPGGASPAPRERSPSRSDAVHTIGLRASTVLLPELHVAGHRAGP